MSRKDLSRGPVQAATVQLSQTIATVGPIPQPQALAAYKEIDAGLVNRIVTMAEKEQAHRHETNMRTVKSTHRRAWGGMVSGLIVALAGLGSACWFATKGHPTAGSVIASVDLVTLVGLFVRGRSKPKPE